MTQQIEGGMQIKQAPNSREMKHSLETNNKISIKKRTWKIKISKEKDEVHNKKQMKNENNV